MSLEVNRKVGGLSPPRDVSFGASLVVQGKRICLPMQKTQEM